jgi:hypothetical protein
MQVPEFPRLTPVQEGTGKIAGEGNCELCSEYFALPFPEVHRISRRLYREMVRDPPTRILVVCHLCHDHIHRLPIRGKDPRALVSRRPYDVRQGIRKALGYKPKHYTPPAETDLSPMYEDWFYHFPPGSFRPGG